MAKRFTKAAIKRAAYEEVMKTQPKMAAKPKSSKARWVKHTWCEKTDSLRTHYWPAAFPGGERLAPRRQPGRDRTARECRAA